MYHPQDNRKPKRIVINPKKISSLEESEKLISLQMKTMLPSFIYKKKRFFLKKKTNLVNWLSSNLRRVDPWENCC